MLKRVLYQPTSIDSINENSVIIRNCQDRADAILDFCQKYFGNSLSEKTLLDLGCGYGYFLNYFSSRCASVQGINISDKEVDLSRMFYPEICNNIKNGDMLVDLYSSDSYDITLFMSVFHTILADDPDYEVNELLKLIDEKTKSVMFFDIRQEGEEFWVIPEQVGLDYINMPFRYSSDGWTPEYIKEYILSRTSFDECEELIVDSDSIGYYEGNFGRTLFAFYRKNV